MKKQMLKERQMIKVFCKYCGADLGILIDAEGSIWFNAGVVDAASERCCKEKNQGRTVGENQE